MRPDREDLEAERRLKRSEHGALFWALIVVLVGAYVSVVVLVVL